MAEQDGWVYVSMDVSGAPMSVGGLYDTETAAGEAAARDRCGGFVAPFFYIREPAAPIVPPGREG